MPSLCIFLLLIAPLLSVNLYSDALTLYYRRMQKSNIINLSDTCTPISCEASSLKCSAKDGDTWHLGQNICKGIVAKFTFYTTKKQLPVYT